MTMTPSRAASSSRNRPTLLPKWGLFRTFSFHCGLTNSSLPQDAHDAGFQIRTFFTPVDGDKFDLSIFWNRFRFDPSEDAEMDNAAMVFSGETRFDALLSLSSEAGKTKRAQFTIPLYLYDGIALGVTGYGCSAVAICPYKLTGNPLKIRSGR